MRHLQSHTWCQLNVGIYHGQPVLHVHSMTSHICGTGRTYIFTLVGRYYMYVARVIAYVVPADRIKYICSAGTTCS